jgi:hypothetical protein
MYTKTFLLALFAAVSVSGAAIDVRAANATGGADFGQCTPTMVHFPLPLSHLILSTHEFKLLTNTAKDFQLGRPGRKATEGTFLPTDPLVAKGQQDALNPNIITNRICDQLTNVCNANAAAKTLCASAKAQVSALGTKDASTATAFNSALGF